MCFYLLCDFFHNVFLFCELFKTIILHFIYLFSHDFFYMLYLFSHLTNYLCVNVFLILNFFFFIFSNLFSLSNVHDSHTIHLFAYDFYSTP